MTKLLAWLRPGIFGRFFLFGLLLVTLTAFAMGNLINYVLDLLLDHQMRPAGEWLVQEMFHTPSGRQERMESLARVGRIRLTLFDAAGHPIASTEPPLAPMSEAQKAALGDKPSLLPDGTDTALFVAVRDGNRLAGYGAVDFAEDDNLEIGVVWVVAVVAAISLIAWPLAASVTRPLRKLSSTVASFGEGRLEARVARPGGSEIGRLGRAFNSMADRIQTMMRSERLLLAAVSHELRTPLQRVRLAAELAAERDRGDTQFASVMADLDDLDSILADVLTFARLEGGIPGATEQILRMELLPVNEFLSDAAARFEAAYPNRMFSWSVAEPGVLLRADSRLLHRALGNLLANAARYSPRAAAIELAARGINQTLVIEVRDHGPGIPSEIATRVFEPFFRADEARTTSGSGLGLAIVKRIVEAHGGQIELESSPAGSLFRLSLPAVTEC